MQQVLSSWDSRSREQQHTQMDQSLLEARFVSNQGLNTESRTEVDAGPSSFLQRGNIRTESDTSTTINAKPQIDANTGVSGINSSTDPIMNGITSSSGPSSTKRFDAIAKLKRAASQRELKGREGVETGTSSRLHTPTETGPLLDAESRGATMIAGSIEGNSRDTASMSNAGTPSSLLTRPGVGGVNEDKPISPIPPILSRLEQLRSESRSPQRSLRDGAGTPTGDSSSLLERSRSQRGDTRSPLPSLEQLRARILHERATAGLARSASTSAASAAARAYALEKLLGESPREGAVSPVSDTAEDQDEQVKRSSNSQLSVPDDSRRPMLRRSRTIGGLSATAEAQRKAAFVQALDEGVPDDVRSIKRSSRRFARAPPGGRTSTSSKPSDPPIVEEGDGAPSYNNVLVQKSTISEIEKGQSKEGGEGTTAEVDGSQSQRQIARAELLRKLSGRGRNGQKSPLPPVASLDAPLPPPSTSSTSNIDRDLKTVGDSTLLTSENLSNTMQASNTQAAAPYTPPMKILNPLGPPLSPGFNLLTVPGAANSNSARSPSSRASTILTSQHEHDRDRASEMALLIGEEAFEYEKLLEMGYSTDDAYERVASARSGSYVEMPNEFSPQSHQEEFTNRDQSENRSSSPLGHLDSPPRVNYDQWTSPEINSSVIVSLPNTSQTKQEEWASKHPSIASIPLGLDARRGSSDDGMDHTMDQGGVEHLRDTMKPLYNRKIGAWPESVTSVTASDSSFPKRSDSMKRDSDTSTSNGKIRPTLTLPSNTNLERIEDVLTPGFLKEIGNPLDYSASPHSPGAPSTFARATERDGMDEQWHGEDEGIDRTTRTTDDTFSDGDDDDDYLREVDLMTRKLQNFTLRTNQKNSRLARDTAVQQSSAAQAIAAASDVARKESHRAQTSDVTASSHATSIEDEILPRNITSEGQQSAMQRTIQQAPPARHSPFNDSIPLPTVANPSSTSIPSPSTLAPSDVHHYALNGKLSPFPGFGSSASAEVSSSSAQRSSPAVQTSSTVSVGKEDPYSHEGQEKEIVEEQKGDNGTTKTPTFLSSLRRKASNAAAKVQGNGTEAPSRKFGSLLRRRPSGGKGLGSTPTVEVEPPPPPSMATLPRNTSQASINSASTVKLVPSPVEPLKAEVAKGKGSGDKYQTSQISSTSLGIPSSSLAPTTAAVLQRYSRILTSSKEAANIPAIPGLTRKDIEQPPRKFLFATPVLQVVTSSTVKDRFLFVFSDLLVIAKPVAPPKGSAGNASALPTLDWTFSVKSILNVDHIGKLIASSNERRHSVKSVPLMDSFVQDFRWNPEQAIDNLISHSNLPRTSATTAQLLHQTPELDRQRLSDYLFGSLDPKRQDVSRAFVNQEKYSGVSIESALRSLLLEIRFPVNQVAFENLLISFATKWISSNRGLIKDSFSEQLAIDLVFAIMSLNDALHSDTQSTPGMFCQSMPFLSRDDFLQNFRRYDEGMVLSDRTLIRIYTSISQEAIQQALLPNEAGPRYAARIRSPGVPTQIIYGVFSSPIRISIPRCDPDFIIRIYGQDLIFQPQVLTFEGSNTQEFRIMSKSLGVKNLVFIKAGRNARYYQANFKAEGSLDCGLPRSINVTVERAFKQFCFTFVHGASLEKFTFSVEGPEMLNQCLSIINSTIANSEDGSTRKGAAHEMALQVLRETIQEPEVPSTLRAVNLQRSASDVAFNSSGSQANLNALHRAPSDSRPFGGGGYVGQQGGGIGKSPATMMNRQESVSKHYYRSQGAHERELAPLREDATATQVQGREEYSVRPLRGQDLILTVKQNSLLSIVVAHLQRI